MARTLLAAALSVVALSPATVEATKPKWGDANPNPGWEKYYGGKCDEFIRCARDGNNVCLERSGIPLCNLEVQQTGIAIPWQRGLGLAVEAGHLHTVQLFIKSPLQWWDKDDVVNEAYETVLMHAAAHGQDEILRWLLTEGADVRKKSRVGETARDLARTSDNADKTMAAIDDFAAIATARLFKILRSNSGNALLTDMDHCLKAGASLTEVDQESQLTPLALAVKNGMLEAVKKLVQLGAPVEYRHPRTGHEILHMACDNGNFQITEVLLAAGADVNSLTTQFKMNCLHLAAMNGRNGIAVHMVDAGVDVNARDWEGETALLKYARQIYGGGTAQQEVLQRIVAAGAELDVCDGDGHTSLFYAVDHNQVGSVQALVEAGARIHAVSMSEQSSQGSGAKSTVEIGAFQQAVQSGSREVALWLVRSGHREAFKYASLRGTGAERGSSLTGLYAVVIQGWDDVALVMLAQPRNDGTSEVNEPNVDGATPLFAAAAKGLANIVTALIKHGASVDHRNRKKETPLLFAASGGHRDVLKVLLEAGANVNHSDKQMQTPLYRAAARGFAAVVQELLKAGATPDLKSYASTSGKGMGRAGMAQLETPAQVARRNGYTEIANFIASHGKEL